MSLRSRRLRAAVLLGALSLATWLLLDPSIWWTEAPPWSGLLFAKVAIFSAIPLRLILLWLGFGPRMAEACGMGLRRMVALWTPDPGATWLAFAARAGSLPQAQRCVSRAAEEGHVEGRLELALAFQEGAYGFGGETAAFPMLQALAQAGHPEAMAHLALAHFWGRGGLRDAAAAERWMRRAAEGGHGGAAAWLARAYATGDGVRLDAAEAERWQAGATDAPLPRRSRLAELRDPESESRWATWAAEGERGMAAAFEIVFADPLLRRIFLFASGALLGGLALGFLTMLLVGWSAFWVFAIPIPVCLLLALWWGGGRTGPTRASRRAWRAAEGGDPGAAFSLGLAFERGDADHPRDPVEARRWYLTASEAGHAEAAYRLGELFAWGQGGAKDRGQARRWLRRAAELGHAGAQARLEELDRLAAEPDR